MQRRGPTRSQSSNGDFYINQRDTQHFCSMPTGGQASQVSTGQNTWTQVHLQTQIRVSTSAWGPSQSATSPTCRVHLPFLILHLQCKWTNADHQILDKAFNTAERQSHASKNRKSPKETVVTKNESSVLLLYTHVYIHTINNLLDKSIS